MATRTSSDSDIYYDFSCSLCDGEGKNEEATKYCEECFVYMCDPCVKNHNKFPLNVRHQLLDNTKFSSLQKSALVSFPTKRCPKHPGELINIFCGDHDVVCCSVCKALGHSSCAKTQHLPVAAKGVQKSKEYETIKQDTRNLISDVDKILNDRQANISRITTQKQRVKQSVEDFRKKINKYFNDLEKKSLDELDAKEKSIISDIVKDKKDLEMTKANAENNLKSLELFKGNNECDLFAQVKMDKQFIIDAKQKLLGISKTERKHSLHFETDKDLEKYITSLKMLGSFSINNVITVQRSQSPVGTSDTSLGPTASTSSATTVSTSSGAVVPPNPKQPKNADGQKKYKPQFTGKVNVKEKNDLQTCNIYKICQLPDGSFLVTDWTNLKLKRLDQSFKPVDYVKLSGNPDSVCAVSPGEAAVSVFKKKKIQMVSLEKKLKLTRSFTVGNYCRGITYINNELFVCCGDFADTSSGCIEVYDMAGKLQRSIRSDSKRLSTVPVPLRIAPTDDGKSLLVTSWKSGTIMMQDMSGNVLNTFNDKNLKGAYGVCTDGKGQVFLCGHESNTVVQLSTTQQTMEVILTEADGIKKPTAVSFDKEQSRLYVSCHEFNEVLVFVLK